LFGPPDLSDSQGPSPPPGPRSHHLVFFLQRMNRSPKTRDLLDNPFVNAHVRPPRLPFLSASYIAQALHPAPPARSFRFAVFPSYSSRKCGLSKVSVAAVFDLFAYPIRRRAGPPQPPLDEVFGCSTLSPEDLSDQSLPILTPRANAPRNFSVTTFSYPDSPTAPIRTMYNPPLIRQTCRRTSQLTKLPHFRTPPPPPQFSPTVPTSSSREKRPARGEPRTMAFRPSPPENLTSLFPLVPAPETILTSPLFSPLRTISCSAFHRPPPTHLMLSLLSALFNDTERPTSPRASIVEFFIVRIDSSPSPFLPL